MGRRLPFEASHSIHPAVSLALLAAWIAAVVAVVAALCGARSKKPTTPKSSQQHWPSPSLSLQSGKASEEPETTATMAATKENETETETPTPLPLPPALKRQAEMAQQQAQEQCAAATAASPRKAKESGGIPLVDDNRGSPKSRRGMVVSLSMRLPDTLSKIKSGKEILRRRVQGSEADKAGESLWTKTIMLGERCRVPDGGDDDNIIYDNKGNRITAYHPKTPRSLPVSRTCSYIDPNAVPTRKL